MNQPGSLVVSVRYLAPVLLAVTHRFSEVYWLCGLSDLCGDRRLDRHD